MEVTLRNSFLGIREASAELPMAGAGLVQIVVQALDDEEGFEEVVTKMRRTLAYLDLVGEFYVLAEGPFVDETHREEAQRIVDGLSERDRTITSADVQRAREEQVEHAKRVNEGLGKQVTRGMKEEGLRRGLNKEEREKMTLEEAFGPEEE
jgi:hypothetical protein